MCIIVGADFLSIYPTVISFGDVRISGKITIGTHFIKLFMLKKFTLPDQFDFWKATANKVRTWASINWYGRTIVFGYEAATSHCSM